MDTTAIMFVVPGVEDMVTVDVARQLGCYCETHDEVYSGFGAGNLVCRSCVTELKNSLDLDTWAGLVKELLPKLCQKEQAFIDDTTDGYDGEYHTLYVADLIAAQAWLSQQDPRTFVEHYEPGRLLYPPVVPTEEPVPEPSI